MRTMLIPASRPRVYLIDFEAAMEFPAECPPVERMSTGYPLGGSFPEPEMYSRPLPPEISSSNNCYCPFKLDIWQLGSSFANFKVCQSTLVLCTAPDQDLYRPPLRRLMPWSMIWPVLIRHLEWVHKRHSTSLATWSIPCRRLRCSSDLKSFGPSAELVMRSHGWHCIVTVTHAVPISWNVIMIWNALSASLRFLFAVHSNSTWYAMPSTLLS